MLTYTKLKRNRRKCVALTGLTPKEFNTLLPAFARAYAEQYPAEQTMTGQPRARQAGGGRKGGLPETEQKLLFILVHQKTYPLQTLLGEVFELSQSRVNEWVHRLVPILKAALDDLGVLPERDPAQFAQSERQHGERLELIIDGTERRRQRPKNPEKQAAAYSGKKKTHCDKNVVIVQAKTKRVGFLSQTYAGKTHDKKIVDTEPVVYPPGTILSKDTGFQGYEPAGVQTRQPKKSPGRGELTAAEKRTNRQISRLRVRVEHALAGVKRSRSVKETLRNTKEGVADLIMLIACGLHNLRVRYRKRRLKL